MSGAPTTDVSRDVLPLFTAVRGTSFTIRSFEGTAFIIAPHVLVTCWHCIRADLPSDQAYVVAVQDPQTRQYSLLELSNRAQHPNGLDLASATVDLQPSFEFRLGREDVSFGLDVWSFGYPLTDARHAKGGGTRFTLHPRYLQGYVMRSFFFDSPSFGRTPSYELDMPAPGGLSGGPVVRVGSRRVVGVFYGSSDVATIEETASVDPISGMRTPEVHRIVSFGLAHHVESLLSLAGPATGNRPLNDLVPAL